MRSGGEEVKGRRRRRRGARAAEVKRRRRRRAWARADLCVCRGGPDACHPMAEGHQACDRLEEGELGIIDVEAVLNTLGDARSA